MSSSVLNNLLREFGSAIGIPDLQLDEEYRCNMMFDEVPVSFELGDGDESMYIYSLLGQVPDDGLEPFYAELLHANYLFAESGGSTLGVDSKSGNVVLLREERLESMRLSTLESVAEQFVSVAEALDEPVEQRGERIRRTAWRVGIRTEATEWRHEGLARMRFRRTRSA